MQSAGASPPKCWLLSWTGEVWTLCSHADSVQPSDYINWKCIDVNKRLTPAFWSLQSEISLCTRPHTDFCSDVFFFFYNELLLSWGLLPVRKECLFVSYTGICTLHWILRCAELSRDLPWVRSLATRKIGPYFIFMWVTVRDCHQQAHCSRKWMRTGLAFLVKIFSQPPRS